MKFRKLSNISALALMISLPAYAAEVSAVDTQAKNGSVTDSVKKGLHSADETMREAADDIKAFLVGKNADGKLEPILIKHSRTAHGLIGQAVVNPKGEKIASLQDIIIGQNGKAILVVLSDGGFLGIGKKVAAFDYDKVISQAPDGKVKMSLSQGMVDRAADFAYDPEEWATAGIVPKSGVSVNALLKGGVLDNAGEKVADIENVYLRDADVSQILVGFNKTLGLGGDIAALDYDDLQLVRQDDKLDFKLTENQSAQFKKFSASVKK